MIEAQGVSSTYLRFIIYLLVATFPFIEIIEVKLAYIQLGAYLRSGSSRLSVYFEHVPCWSIC